MANVISLSSGVDQVIAGTNVTITGSTSYPVINSSGGGGGGVQSVSGSLYIGTSGTLTDPIITNLGVNTLNTLIGNVTISEGSNISFTTVGNDITINSSASNGVTSLNSVTGVANITAGSNITVTPSGQNINVSANIPACVNSLNSITGIANITAGSNITVTPSGQNIDISANIPASVNSLNSLNGIVNITAGSGITVTPSGQNIQIDSIGGGVQSQIANGVTNVTCGNDGSIIGLVDLTLPNPILSLSGVIGSGLSTTTHGDVTVGNNNGNMVFNDMGTINLNAGLTGSNYNSTLELNQSGIITMTSLPGSDISLISGIIGSGGTQVLVSSGPGSPPGNGLYVSPSTLYFNGTAVGGGAASGVTSVQGATGIVTFSSSSDTVSFNTTDNNIDINAVGAASGVTSLNTLTGVLTLSSSTLTIANSGGTTITIDSNTKTVQYLTTGSFPVEEGYNFMTITACGGGGAGGGTSGNAYYGGGGGGSGYIVVSPKIPIRSGLLISASIGAGGIGILGDGGDGNPTTVLAPVWSGYLVNAPGGGGGKQGLLVGDGGNGGSGQYGGGGGSGLLIAGAGGVGSILSGNVGQPGGGGALPGGAGALSNIQSTLNGGSGGGALGGYEAVDAGLGCGGEGGGNPSGSGAIVKPGSNGGAGYVIITYEV